jgi:hypothetical protein
MKQTIQNFDLFLNEIGNMAIPPYNYNVLSPTLDRNNQPEEYKYIFKNSNGVTYVVRIYKETGRFWQIMFAPIEDGNMDIRTVVNNGDFYKVMSTVFTILKEFVETIAKSLDIHTIIVQGDKKLLKDNDVHSKRIKAYYEYIKQMKNIFKDIKLSDNVIYLKLN